MKKIISKESEELVEELEALESKIHGASDQYVNLFFIFREREQQHEEIKIEYKAIQYEINDPVSRTFLRIAKKKIRELLSEKGNLQYQQYNPAIEWDRSTVGYISKKLVKYLRKIQSSMNLFDADTFDVAVDEVPWAYAVLLEDVKLILFRKYSQSRILEKRGWIPFFVSGRMFTKVDEHVVAIDEEIDCIYDIVSGKVYIFNKKQFEAIFSFMDSFVEEIEMNKSRLIEMNLVDDVDRLIILCKKDPQKTRKIFNILGDIESRGLTKDKVKQIDEQYILGLRFTSDGKMKVDQKNIWTILRVLDDDYLLSPATGNQYEVYSKSNILSRFPRIKIDAKPEIKENTVRIKSVAINADKIIWYWGDGKEEECPCPAKHTYEKRREHPAKHIYKEGGKYTIEVTAYRRNRPAKASITVNIPESTDQNKNI